MNAMAMVAFAPVKGDRVRMRGGLVTYEVTSFAEPTEESDGTVVFVRHEERRGTEAISKGASVSWTVWNDIIGFGASSVEAVERRTR